MLRGLDGFLIPLLLGYNCAVLRVRRGLVSSVFGGHSEGETPLPIPNRVVKPLSADGTWPSRAWESRSPPIIFDGPSGRAARRVSAAFAGTFGVVSLSVAGGSCRLVATLSLRWSSASPACGA